MFRKLGVFSLLAEGLLHDEIVGLRWQPQVLERMIDYEGWSEPSNLVDADVPIPRKFAKKRALNPSAEASRTVSPSPTDKRTTSPAPSSNQDIKKRSFHLVKYFALGVAAIVLLSTLVVGAAFVNSIAALTQNLEVPVEGVPPQASNVRSSAPRHDAHTTTSRSRSSYETRGTSFESASAT